VQATDALVVLDGVVDDPSPAPVGAAGGHLTMAKLPAGPEDRLIDGPVDVKEREGSRGLLVSPIPFPFLPILSPPI
jgi:hypothetical protein